MNKCNCANGWCGGLSKFHGCMMWDRSLLINEEGYIKLCAHRLRMNRLEKAYKKHGFGACDLSNQWEKEKSKK